MLRKMWNLSSGAAVAPGGKGESCAQLNHGNTKEQLFADLHQEVGSGRCIKYIKYIISIISILDVQGRQSKFELSANHPPTTELPLAYRFLIPTNS